MQEKYEKYLKYLPSKKFATMVSVVSVLVIGVFIVFASFSNQESFSALTTKNTALKVENQTINDLIEQDSDSDGIVDWEETLWGTNKNKAQTFDNMRDDVYIANKKATLNLTENVEEARLTETEKFAREFFSSFSAMKASGEVDKDTINAFSNALGQKIVNPILDNIYTEINLKIDVTEDANSIENKIKYYESVQKLFKTYQSSGIGDELDIINTGLASGEGSANVNKLSIIATAYQNFAKKIMGLSVPSELAEYHLQIANSANNTGIAVLNMKEVISDPLVGLEGITQYQKYSDDLVKAVEDLETVLTE